jgi:predicted nucleotidyltransferase
VELFVLFGSAADDDQDPGDVDIAVAFDRAAPADVLGLLEELHRATGYEGFDVLDLRRAGPVAREQALVDCRLLHQAEPGLFANAQIAAIMERIETDEFRRIQLELMAG